MLLTESRLRQIIAEEYKNITKEGWSARRVAAMRSKTSGPFGPGGASRQDAAMQVLFSIFNNTTESDFSQAPELAGIAKRLYSGLAQRFGKEAVDEFIKENKLDIILDYVN